MASHKLFIVPFLLLMVLATTQLAQCNILKAKISCLDCQSNYDFSGNMIAIKCNGMKNITVAITEANGSFETRLPFEASNDSEAAASNCVAKLVGGPHQLYAARKDMASTVIKATNSNFFTIATALKFSTCKENRKCKAIKEFMADSKTIDLPLPPEWGLPPSSYYLPVLPIIGIP